MVFLGCNNAQVDALLSLKRVVHGKFGEGKGEGKGMSGEL